METLDSRFMILLQSLLPKFRELVAMAPVRYGVLPRLIPIRGIYLFSEDTNYLYVGRTNKLRQRLRNHCTPSGDHFKATFAFRLAREITGRLKPTYAKLGSRADLINDVAFASAFQAAKRRIATMDLRYVEEADPTRQALLEIYTATVLKTPYNDFDTH
jgi:hypothetical protein